MNIEIQALNFHLTLTEHHYVERRMAFAFGNSEQHIQNAEVSLSKISTSGGNDCYRCLTQVTLADGTLIIVENTEPDLYVATHRAADRTGWKIARCLGRKKLEASHRMSLERLPGNHPSQFDYMQHTS